MADYSSLAEICGQDFVAAGVEADAIGGVVPGIVCRPADTSEVSRVMAACSAGGWAVVVRGSGSKLQWGHPPRSLDVVLDTTRMNDVVEHAAGDLVVTAHAGTPLERLQEVVGTARQRLVVDSPHPAATMGGLVSTNAAGPRRMLYGSVRDILIGLTVVLADGTVAKSGGKVVKNVAGYDLGKLFAGAFGTLGVVTQATFRLHPQPQESAYVVATCERPADVKAAVTAVRRSQVVASAAEVERVEGGYRVGVLVEGVARGVEARADDCARLVGGRVQPDPPPGWGRLPGGDGSTIIKVVAEPAALDVVLGVLDDVVGKVDPGYQVSGSAGVDVVHAAATIDSSALGDILRQLRTALTRHDGSVVVASAPAGSLGEIDVWGPARGIELMRRIKDEFDPAGLLAPGRFVGGI